MVKECINILVYFCLIYYVHILSIDGSTSTIYIKQKQTKTILYKLIDLNMQFSTSDH